MFDLKRTLALVRGALLDPEPAWRAYLPEAGDWKKTAFLLTGPLIVAAAVIAYLLGFLGSGTSILGFGRPTLGSMLLQICMGAVIAALIALIYSALAGAFRGKSSFALGLAATTLAFVPGYVGQALSGLPWIGALLAFGLFIYALVLLWKIIPIYLEVPDSNRAAHYIVSLLACIVAVALFSTMLGRMMYPGGVGVLSGADSSDAVSGGVFGTMSRQGELLALAEQDTYTPPPDGKVTESQVQAFIRVMARAREMQAEKDKRLQEIAKKAEDEEQMSMSDFGQIMGSVTDFAGMQTAEIEVVKTADGNWAEHQWVRESLRTAWIQKDINDTVAHNYGLYQQYAEDLADYIAR
ncbi:MAG: Yip1 family protein [Woeseia sp.]